LESQTQTFMDASFKALEELVSAPQRERQRKQLVIITGMSGSGKSLAANTFEDLNFYCIDNIPPRLMPDVIRQWSPPSNPEDVAVVMDARSGQFYNDLLPVCMSLRENPGPDFYKPLILFLNTSDGELVKRFKETRRKHPLVTNTCGITEAIQKEREMLADMCEQADKVIDTTNLEPEELRRLVREFFGSGPIQDRLMIAVMSFGFKHGVPLDADVVFDVRFLANPYWIPDLRHQDGTLEGVRQFVLADPLTEPLTNKLFDLVEFSIPQYIREGKAYLTIAIGCTGGRHRSVVVAEELYRFLASKEYLVRLEHRDLKRRGQ